MNQTWIELFNRTIKTIFLLKNENTNKDIGYGSNIELKIKEQIRLMIVVEAKSF